MHLSFSQSMPRSTLIATIFSGMITAESIPVFSRIYLFSYSNVVANFEVWIADASSKCPLVFFNCSIKKLFLLDKVLGDILSLPFIGFGVEVKYTGYK